MFSNDTAALVQSECPAKPDLQIIIGDGLSVTAVASQVPPLLPCIVQLAKERGWTIGRPFAVRYCRVGIMNHVGELLSPKVVLLLIGERPGLATAESLSAYMAFQPRKGDNDARRNLISNIHARGVATEVAAMRIINLAETMMAKQLSGVQIKESLESPKWLKQNGGKEKGLK
jgi:ethanolamine ammonia-lyase small subunit